MSEEASAAVEAAPPPEPVVPVAADEEVVAAAAAAPPAAPTSWAARLQAAAASQPAAAAGAQQQSAQQPAARASPPASRRLGAVVGASTAAASASAAASTGTLSSWEDALSRGGATLLEQRGMVNNGNACYVNATMQLLLGCSPFLSLLHHVAAANPVGAALPTLHALVALAAEFPLASSRGRADGRAGARGGGHEPGAASVLLCMRCPPAGAHGTRPPCAARALCGTQCASRSCLRSCWTCWKSRSAAATLWSPPRRAVDAAPPGARGSSRTRRSFCRCCLTPRTRCAPLRALLRLALCSC
jgi:hypothetical protein